MLTSVDARLERSRWLVERLIKEQAKENKTQIGMQVGCAICTLHGEKKGPHACGADFRIGSVKYSLSSVNHS